MTWQISLAALLAALVTVTVVFAIARMRGRYDTIDTAWGAGFALIALVTLAVSDVDAPAVLVTVLTVVWGVRLSVHLHLRNRGKPEDQRYQDMLARARKYPAVRMFARVYLTQGLVMWFVSLPVQAVHYDVAASLPNWLAVVGVVIWFVGMFFETVGDEQLRRFKADPAHEGAVLDRGLWRYTRHPNYFGDACVWWGVYLAACQNWIAVATIVAPLLMTWLLARGTGKPLLERGMRQRRPAYASYVDRTSGFFPLPPR